MQNNPNNLPRVPDRHMLTRRQTDCRHFKASTNTLPTKTAASNAKYLCHWYAGGLDSGRH